MDRREMYSTIPYTRGRDTFGKIDLKIENLDIKNFKENMKTIKEGIQVIKELYPYVNLDITVKE